MSPPRNQRGHRRINSKGGVGWKDSGRGRGKRDGQPHRGRFKGQESNPDNENLYSEVDRFHMQKDLITFDGADANSEESDDESGEEEAVMNLKGVNGGGSSGSGSESSEESEDDDSDVSELPELPEHVRRAALGAASSEDDSEDDEDGKGKFAAGWGKNRSSYYDADTADLEIGQEFEEAEAEEEAALEQQRASYKELDPADFGEEEEEEEDVDEDKNDEKKTQAGKKGSGKAKKRIGSSARGAALLEMKSDLEQIALGGGEEIMASMVKKDIAKLTRRDKLERVLSEAPELPSLLAELKAHLGTLTEKVQPLVSNVTADLGASEDGLMYLRTRQQLLLAFCMNVCFYMVLKAKGKSAKGHPVIRRLLSLRALLADMSALDDRMSSQVDLLLRALDSGIDFTNAAGDDNSDVDEESNLEDNDSAVGDVEESSADGRDGEIGGMDEEDIEEGEAAFMGNSGEGDNGKGISSKKDEGEAEASSSAGAVKKRRRLAAMMSAVGDPSLGDFGDEDESVMSRAGVVGGGNILQGIVNRISQRERSLTKKRGGLQGDQDVPIRERDQTIRVSRPVPGEDDGDAVENDGAEQDSDADDLGLGGDGFLGGIPAELLDGLSRRKPAGEEKRRGKKASRDQGGDGGADGEEEGKTEEDAFYAAVAEQKERKKRAKKEKYTPERRIAGALEAELEAERAARGETKRGASYTMIKNKGLTPHKNKLNRNPRVKKREAFRKATIRRKGQVREIRTGEADRYGGEFTGIKANVIRSRKLKG